MPASNMHESRQLLQPDFSQEHHISLGNDTSPPSPKPALASWTTIYLLCIANFGLSCAWALEFSVTTPYFSERLNATPLVSHGVWVIGPLSGLIVAPIVGTLSDRNTSQWGRRRPFIAFGLVCTLIGMAIFSSAYELGTFFIGTAAGKEHTDRRDFVSIVIAIFAFSIMDLAINTTMWPVRALQGDLVPAEQQHDIQSASVVMGALGDFAANFIVNSFDEPVSMMRFCFLIVGILYTISVSILLVVGKEKPLGKDSSHLHTSRRQSLNILSYLRHLPRWMWKVGLTYAFGFFALFCVMPNASTWLASSVLKGNPSAPVGSKDRLAYEHGVKTFGKASLFRSALMMVFAAVYPHLLKFVSPGHLMGYCFGTFAILHGLLSGTDNVMVAKFLVTVMALPMAAEFTLIIGVTVKNSQDSNRGRFLGALNCFAVIPQLIDTAYTGYVSKVFGEVSVMRIGAVWGVVTSIFAFRYMDVS